MQNQGPDTADVTPLLAVEDETDFESRSVGRGEGVDNVSAGLNASEAGDGSDTREDGFVGFRPER